MSRIAGITVEIGGDVTGLDKALKSVNSTIKTTQSQLKDVERLLKLDPTNTELLSQKQEKLKESISATKEKLEALKNAQEQAKEQMENSDLGKDKYEALQREIVATEEELAKLAKEAAEANTALCKIEEAGKSLETVGNKIAGVGKTLTTAVTVPIVALGTAAVKTTADFDAEMSKVQAISGATGEQFDELRDKAREMGSKTKFSATEAGEAFEYMAMAGWKTENMLDGIEGIMNLAAASGEDLATTSDIVTDALTAFGLTASDAGHFADILATASANANTNVSMMGETFQYVAPIAGALGYTAEDTALAIGLMANSGIKSSQAGTTLRKIMTQLNGEIKISGQNLGDVTIQTANADGSMRSFNDILMDCREAFSHLTDSEKASTAEALVGKTAMSGFLALMNASDDDVNQLADAIANCDGSAESMAETMQDNLSGQLTILKSALQELAIEIGDTLMPTIRNIVSKIQEFVLKLQQMDEKTRNAVIKMALLAAAIGPVLLVVGKLTAGVGKAMQTFAKLGKSILTLVYQAQLGVGAGGKIAAAIAAIGPVGLVVIGVIALLVAAFVTLWKNNEQFRDKVTSIWNGIKEKFESFGQGIVERLNEIGFNFTSFTEVLSAVWNGFCAVLTPVFEAAFEIISIALSSVLDVLTGLLDIFIGLFTGNWSQAWTGVQEIFTGIWNGIKQFLTDCLNAIKMAVDLYLASIGTDWNTVWTNITTFLSNAWSIISTTVVTGIGTVKSAISTGLTNAKDTVTSIFTSIKTTIASVMNEAKNTVSNAITAIRNKFHFTWSLPHLAMPHITISGSFSLKPPRAPTFSVSWYKKAMENGMILNSPTIFGMQGNTLLAGGEAGSEAVVGTQSLMEMIQSAVANMAGDTTVNYGGVNINVYAKENQDIRALADEIESRINSNVMRRKAAVGT